MEKFNVDEKKLLEKFDDLKEKYPNIYKRIKRYLIGLTAVPIIIWLLYFIGDCGFVLIKTSLTVGDALVFYGSILAFIGTVSLGTLALWQNIKLEKSQEQKENILNSCSIIINATEFKQNSQLPENVLSQIGTKKYEVDNGKLNFYMGNRSEPMLKKIIVRFNNDIFEANLSMCREDNQFVGIPLPKSFYENCCDIEFVSCYDVSTFGKIYLSNENDRAKDFAGNSDARVKQYIFYGLQNKEEK